MCKLRLAAAIAAIALTLGGCGSNSNGADAKESSAVKRPSATPPSFHQTEYDVETTWEQEASDKRQGGYLESVWHDPGGPEYKMAIDSRPSDGTAPPLASAELAQLQVSDLPGYRETGFKKANIYGRPAIRWTYNLDDTHHYAYFFAECGVSIVLRGPGPIGVDDFGFFYDTVTSRIKPVCDG
jgi:hypothetical protein